MKAKHLFDWLKGARRLLAVSALGCAFAGNAFAWEEPPLPDLPSLPDIPPFDFDEDDEEEEEETYGKEAIIYIIAKFVESANNEGGGQIGIAKYDQRIKDNPEDWEAYICRSFARFATLWDDLETRLFAFGCGLDIDNPILHFGKQPPERLPSGKTVTRTKPFSELPTEIDTNRNMDDVCGYALPVLKQAIDDLSMLPEDWSELIEFSERTGYRIGRIMGPDYGTYYLDYADVQMIKAIYWGLMSFLELARGYNPYSAGVGPDGVNHDALAASRDYFVNAGKMIRAFRIAQDRRTYLIDYLFMVKPFEASWIQDTEQDFLNLPYWTAEVDLMQIAENARFHKKWKKDILRGRQLYVSLRSLFEGEVSAKKGTFPEIVQNNVLISRDWLDDPTCGGLFPELDRKSFGEIKSVIDLNNPYDYEKDTEVKYHAVIYKLPEGAQNDLDNPATYMTDQCPIVLKSPTFAGHKFVGWSNGGVIPAGSEEAMEFKASFIPQWDIGATSNDTVTAYMDGSTLVIEGSGAMRDFESAPPWGTEVAAIDFGAQVTNVGANAFAGYAELKTLTMRGNPPTLGLGNDLSGVTIVVREDALNKFNAAEGWSGLNYGEAVKVGYDWQNVKTLAPFLHEVWYNDYVFDEKRETLSKEAVFSCSSVRNGNFIGRNFDFFLDDRPEFIVHVRASPEKGRFASVGMAMHTGMHEDGVTNGQYTASYDLIPNRMLDGINEKGVAINQNVVAYDPKVAAKYGRELRGTNPAAPNLDISFVTRMVLDQATNAAHAVDLIKSRNLVGMSVSGDLLHYMISDSNETYVVEIITNSVVARHAQVMTNFNLNWDNEHARAVTDVDTNGCRWVAGWYPEPTNLVVAAGNLVAATNQVAKYYPRHAEGVERFVRLRDNYAEGADFQGMMSLMRRAQYSQSSTLETRPYWYSDRCSVELDKKLTEAGYPAAANTYMLYGLKYYQNEADPQGLLGESLDSFLDRELMTYERACLADKDAHRREDSQVWLTVHNTTYDIKNRMFRVIVQENYEQMFDVYLNESKHVKPIVFMIY